MLKKTKIALLTLAIGISAYGQANTVLTSSVVPYSEDSRVAQNIRTECHDLGAKLAQFTQEFSKKSSTKVQLVESIDAQQSGRVLRLEITDAVSMGNAFTGHHKSTSARGTLLENGNVIATFEARRQSMGGAFAGYKGSCSVLGRTVKAMGKDIAQWLENPNNNARLGDM